MEFSYAGTGQIISFSRLDALVSNPCALTGLCLPLPDALRVTAQSSNHWLSHDLSAEAFKHLTRGWPLGEALKKADPKTLLLNEETLQLLNIASESGFLAQMLSKRASTLGSLLSGQLSNLSQTLEPLLIILVGIIIGGLVIILYLLIFQMGQIV